MEEPSQPRNPTGWGLAGRDPARWELWRLPPRAVALVLAVEVAAVVSVVAHLMMPARNALTGETLALAAFLTLLSVVHTELATGIERIRRRAAETSYFDLSSVWTFAAALLLPPALAAAVIAAVYLHLWHRVWRPAKVPLHRHLYTTATVVLAAGAAHTAVERAGGLPGGPDDVAGVAGIAGAVLIYVVVNTLLVAGVIALTSEWPGLRCLVGRLGRQRDGGGHALHGRARRRRARVDAMAGRARAAADPRAAPRGAGAPPRGGGEHRRQDRPAQRGRMAGGGGAGAAPGATCAGRGRRAHPRPGPLQAGQRRPRAPRG